MCVQVVVPLPERATEGMLKFTVELSPMASPAFATRCSSATCYSGCIDPRGRTSDLNVELVRILERSIRISRAVDCESLCIVAGEKVRAALHWIASSHHEVGVADPRGCDGAQR